MNFGQPVARQPVYPVTASLTGRLATGRRIDGPTREPP